MSAARPWMKFYPTDWRADEMLRNCSLGARGLWIEILALMHRSERYGFLLINGKQPSDRQLAVQAGATMEEVQAGLAELESEAVFSRDKDGVIYSRRMVRDEQKHDKLSRMGKKGARAKQLKSQENDETLKGGLEGTPKGGLQPRGQRPDKKNIQKNARIPLVDDWQPEPFGEGSQSRKIVDGWTPEEQARQIEAFKAHHIGNGTKWADWQKAWSTWVLNSVNFGRPRPAFNGGGSVQRNPEDVVLDEIQRRAVAGR